MGIKHRLQVKPDSCRVQCSSHTTCTSKPRGSGNIFIYLRPRTGITTICADARHHVQAGRRPIVVRVLPACTTGTPSYTLSRVAYCVPQLPGGARRARMEQRSGVVEVRAPVLISTLLNRKGYRGYSAGCKIRTPHSLAIGPTRQFRTPIRGTSRGTELCGQSVCGRGGGGGGDPTGLPTATWAGELDRPATKHQNPLISLSWSEGK